MKFLMSDDKNFAERYTLSTFKLSKDKIKIPTLNYDEEKNTWTFKTIYNEKIDLTEDEVIRLCGCFMCNKIKINNWKEYCSSNCPYYFNTNALKKIMG